jgi:ribonucleotide reductase alpha subunit
VIDLNYYPTEEAKISNFKNRPVGIGVQGLVDVYNIMGFPFGSDEAKKLNKQIEIMRIKTLAVKHLMKYPLK